MSPMAIALLIIGWGIFVLFSLSLAAVSARADRQIERWRQEERLPEKYPGKVRLP